MKGKENAKLIELYESRKVKKAIYSRCKANQIWTPNYNLTYPAPPCQC